MEEEIAALREEVDELKNIVKLLGKRVIELTLLVKSSSATSSPAYQPQFPVHVHGTTPTPIYHSPSTPVHGTPDYKTPKFHPGEPDSCR